MTTETILTDEQIEHGRHNTFSTNNPFCPCDSKTMRKAARWAEKAVLQSSEIQALRKDAERYRWLRDSGSDDMGVVTGIYGIDYGSTSVAYTHEDGLCGEQLDKAIDAAMEK